MLSGESSGQSGRIDRCVADGLDMQTRQFVVCNSPVSLGIERSDQ